ncbi:MAG: NYN domain-containing protein, partial [Candidatus Peribacteraceae bacterium]|nr:NYN domain-containing protein [Candidatus Peribacteraceae bacterium]
MFKAKTDKIRGIASNKEKVIQELEKLLTGSVSIYIDVANVRPWSEKLKWHIDYKRLKQFLDSFGNVTDIKYYNGHFEEDSNSLNDINKIREMGYTVRTKPIKIMRQSIDATSIPISSDVLLSQFIRRALLRGYRGEVIEYLNKEFLSMNQLGRFFIEDRKCNFDVEISVDAIKMIKHYDTFCIFSGDADFVYLNNFLRKKGKKVIIIKGGFITSKLRKSANLVINAQKIKKHIAKIEQRPDKSG